MKLSEKFDCMEKEIIENTKEKLLRDRFDHESNTVYMWKRPQFQFRHRKTSTLGNVVKYFSFSDTKVLDYTLAASASDSTLDGMSREDVQHGADSHLNSQSSLSQKKKGEETPQRKPGEGGE